MGEILSQHPPPAQLQGFYFFKFHLIPLSVFCVSHTWVKGNQNDHYACQGKTDFDFSLGSTSGPPQLPASGNSALLGGVVKGANSFFSNIKDMSNKVMQSVAGYVQHFCGCSWELIVSLRNRTARRRGWQNVCVWQTWQGYNVHVMSCSSLSINVFWFLQKDLFKGKWWLAKSYFKQICCHSCHTRFAVFFPLPSCCVSSLIIQLLNDSWLILSWHYCTVCAARAGTCTQYFVWVNIVTCFLYLTIIPWAWMGCESIAHEAEGWMGYWLRGHEGERNNCFSKIQLVGQK